ncbi:hypothetical protein JMJ77_0007222 [Colletotrichum scovillei]|uniref:Uncharacterized protein n=1 Tax=Colletotrichum scovillei TaxID=1209932 RepID=A0A9P7RDP4_9PEZI|nr:hypothetical protein JMJ77_0007222 [Colletotrichum scovillei]KAG7074189.1 hypothetical protein JMJ76_0010674 [Colletotrichum scovillei]KAG7081310.1 hypothetical protein JMJ78_0003434 [Colletotrichum scovillei]
MKLRSLDSAILSIALQEEERKPGHSQEACIVGNRELRSR